MLLFRAQQNVDMQHNNSMITLVDRMWSGAFLETAILMLHQLYSLFHEESDDVVI